MKLLGKRWGLKRVGLIVLTTLVVVLAVPHLALLAATPLIKRETLKALGPGGSIEHVGVGWFSLSLSGLRVAAPAGWPTKDQLRVAHVDIVLGTSALAGLADGELRVRGVNIVEPWLAARRSEDGHMEVLPGVIGSSESVAPESASKGPPLKRGMKLEQIAIENGAFEFFDASVAQPALKLRLEAIAVTIKDVRLPSMTGHSAVDVAAVFKGVQRDGSIGASGWTELATRDAALKTKLRGIDLMALEPYLIKANATGVKQGRLDLDLDATVTDHQLKAPGYMTLTNFELLPDQGAWGSFLGIPRKTAIAYLKNKNNNIGLDFALKGDIDDPQFSITAALAVRLAAATADALGVSLRGLAEGVGSAVGQLLGGSKEKKDDERAPPDP